MAKELVTKKVELPVDPEKLQVYVQVGKKKHTARKAQLDALKVLATDEDAYQFWLACLLEAIEEEYWTWKAHSKLGEVLGPADDDGKQPNQFTKPLEVSNGLSRWDKFVARLYYKADVEGKLEKLLKRMRDGLDLVKYSAPISVKGVPRGSPILSEYLEVAITRQFDINSTLSAISEHPDQVDSDRMVVMVTAIRDAVEIITNFKREEKDIWVKMLKS